jgi:hypothetical protein
MNSLLLLNNNIIRFLKNDYAFAIYVILILLLTGCTSLNKINVNKIPHFELILLVLISYLSFFVPKYGILLIIYYCHFKIKKMKNIVDNKIAQLNKKNKKLAKQTKIITKTESFTPSATKTISSKSSCQVCKAFAKPKFDSVAHFKNKKIENRRVQEAGFRKQKHVNQRQPFR